VGQKIERFEDIVAWQEARELNREVYRLGESSRLAKDFALRDQIRRASISIMANIAEGFERRSKRDFRHFLGIALGSTAEVRSHLYIALDLGYLEQTDFDKLYQRATLISRLIFGFMKRLSTDIDSGR
jgi:four helix bundle protein